MEDNSFRPLPETYSQSGYSLQLKKRGRKGAIYHCHVESEGDEKPHDVYEVFVIKRAKATTLKVGGKETFVPERERTPGNEDFGKWAWSTSDEKHAELIFDEIENNIRPSKGQEEDGK